MVMRTGHDLSAVVMMRLRSSWSWRCQKQVQALVLKMGPHHWACWQIEKGPNGTSIDQRLPKFTLPCESWCFIRRCLQQRRFRYFLSHSIRVTRPYLRAREAGNNLSRCECWFIQLFEQRWQVHFSNCLSTASCEILGDDPFSCLLASTKW